MCGAAGARLALFLAKSKPVVTVAAPRRRLREAGRRRDRGRRWHAASRRYGVGSSFGQLQGGLCRRAPRQAWGVRPGWGGGGWGGHHMLSAYAQAGPGTAAPIHLAPPATTGRQLFGAPLRAFKTALLLLLLFARDSAQSHFNRPSGRVCVAGHQFRAPSIVCVT